MRKGHASHRGCGDEVRALGSNDGGGLATRGLRSEGVFAVGGGRGSVFLRLHPRVQDAQRPHPAQRGHVAGSSAGTCRMLRVRGLLVDVMGCFWQVFARCSKAFMFVYGQAGVCMCGFQDGARRDGAGWGVMCVCLCMLHMCVLHGVYDVDGVCHL